MATKKTIEGYLKIVVPAGQASPSPPLGPALGQRKLNIMDVCKAFNAIKHADGVTPGTPVSTIITIYKDKTFDVEAKGPSASYLIKKELSVTKGSSAPGRDVCATLSKDKLKKIAQVKINDLNAFNIEAACNVIAGTARSMGIEVEE